MPDLTLGAKPKTLRVELVAGADFVTGLRSEVSGVWTDWEVGTELSIVFNDPDETTWTANIDGSLAQWNEDEADVDALIEAHPRKAKLWYVNGPVKLLWAMGEVVYS